MAATLWGSPWIIIEKILFFFLSNRKRDILWQCGTSSLVQNSHWRRLRSSCQVHLENCFLLVFHQCQTQTHTLGMSTKSRWRETHRAAAAASHRFQPWNVAPSRSPGSRDCSQSSFFTGFRNQLPSCKKYRKKMRHFKIEGIWTEK